jgi:diguanylate cyclase (GGDEF)-like protein
LRGGKRRRIREIVISTGVTLCLVGVLAVIQHFIWQAAAERGLLSLARVVGSNSTAALAFGNAADAAEILAACESAPAVTRARLVLPGGRVIAQYSAAHGEPLLLGLPMPAIAVDEAIQLQGRAVGRIEMSASLEPVFRQTLYFLGSGLAVVCIGAILAAFFSARLRQSVVFAEERMAYLALYDTLTGLPNRNSFRDALDAAVARLRRDGREFAVLFVDFDGFKQVNDTHGHAAGDQVLIDLGKRLERSLRANDFVARISGDEFVVLLDQPDSAEAVGRIAAKLVELMGQPIRVGERSITVGASVGVALAPADGVTANELLQRADAAMYHAKQRGKNGYQFFSSVIEQQTRQRLELEQALREACAREQFRLVYQPIYDLRSGRVASAEALLRWNHPQRGPVSPAEFIPVAEDCGLIPEIGLAVLRRVAADLVGLAAKGIAIPPLAVNLSFRQFARNEGEALFFRELDRLGLAPDRIEFELTESVSLNEAQGGRALVERLEARGYRLAVDDFGTGYSSLGALCGMKNAKLKIDRSLIRAMGEGSQGLAIVDAVLRMARALSIPVVAEGIETEAELSTLYALDCDYGQGFLLAKPISVDELTVLLAAEAIPA